MIITPSLYDRRQRVILRIGAVYDAGFGVPLFFIPAMLTALLRVPMPDGPSAIWIQLDGIFLMVVGAIYWIMSQNPSRYLGIVLVILLGKAGSIAFYLYNVFALGASKSFILFAALDTIMFFLHLWALGPRGFVRLRESLRAVSLDPA
jgi:hypothetical protein